MKLDKIYTKTGDDGTTSLVGGVRVPKTHKRLEAYGTIDELNSNLGLLRAYLREKEYIEIIEYVQNELFSIGSYLATDQTKTTLRIESIIHAEDIKKLELEIDKINTTLAPLNTFILPGGNVAACQSHVCRSVCRRAERRIVELQSECDIDSTVLKFVNRLSDFLFVLSRKLNSLTQTDEIYWNKTCK